MALICRSQEIILEILNKTTTNNTQQSKMAGQNGCSVSVLHDFEAQEAHVTLR